MEQQQCQQRLRRRRRARTFAKQMTQPSRFLADVVADRLGAARSAVAFIEQRVEYVMNDVQPKCQLIVAGKFEPHIRRCQRSARRRPPGRGASIEYPPTSSFDSANGPPGTDTSALTTAPPGFKASPPRRGVFHTLVTTAINKHELWHFVTPDEYESVCFRDYPGCSRHSKA